MDKIEKLLGYLPRQVKDELYRIALSRGIGLGKISEIRIRCPGSSSAVMLGERVILAYAVCPDDISRSFSLMCQGAVYAQRETIKEGYITLFGGIRVGICGQARYDGGALVGISNPSALVFRIPTEVSLNLAPLYEAWNCCTRGMLIYSPPGIGKTTALRRLAGLIGGAKRTEQVAVIDERGEFISADYENLSVDILRGYKRADGMEIALRTLSPTVIVVDEIGRRREAEAMLESLNSGVKILASAHAGSFDELSRRAVLKPFFDAGIFDVFVSIRMNEGKRIFVLEGTK